jgi:hypothetical protein
MAVSKPASLYEIARPLFDRFGPALTLVREGERVRWSYSDSAAVVELSADGAVAATFLAAPSRDAASDASVRAVYAPPSPTYSLTERGVRCMVDDVAAFFSGVREPRFRFVAARLATEALEA